MLDFLMEHDANRKETGVVAQSDVIYNAFITANVEKIITVPAGADIALFASTANFFCKMNATAAIPIADVTDGSGSELNPTSRQVNGISTIHLISSSDCIITISFYNVPRPAYTHIPTGY